MKNKDIIRIINEEISNFDFLSMDQIREDEEDFNTINSKEFQISFVNDILNNIHDKTKFKEFKDLYKNTNEDDLEIDPDWGNTPLNIEYDLEVKYIYNGKEIPITLHFEGKEINYDPNIETSRGDYLTPSYERMSYRDIDWGDIELTVYDSEGDDVNFDWLKNNEKLYYQFVKQLVRGIFRYDIAN